jgi:membrane fusion protein (multidrug efflux system)
MCFPAVPDEESVTMSEEHDQAVKREHPVAVGAGWLMAAVCLVGLGWLGRGMMPATGAGGPSPMMMGPPPGMAPLVVAQAVTEEALNPPATFIGHVEPVRDVDLRAQIDGYVTEVSFKEGALVRAGDALFTINPEQYEARVALRRAEQAQAEAALDRAERFQKRLEASDARGVSQADVDTARSDVAQGRAAVQQAKANLALAEIDLKHTRIVAPIDGRIGRTVANVGDFVSPSLGTLVRIVQFDPIRVVFSVTDREYLKVRESIAETAMQGTLRVRLKLPTGTILDVTGIRDFENNEMSAETATLPVRVRFDNSQGLLVPNGYVTVLIDQAAPKKWPVVSQAALVRDREGPLVYVVGQDGLAYLRRVETGSELDGRVELRQGVAVGERVVVQGVQKVTPGQPVQVAPEGGGKAGDKSVPAPDKDGDKSVPAPSGKAGDKSVPAPKAEAVKS